MCDEWVTMPVSILVIQLTMSDTSEDECSPIRVSKKKGNPRVTSVILSEDEGNWPETPPPTIRDTSPIRSGVKLIDDQAEMSGDEGHEDEDVAAIEKDEQENHRDFLDTTEGPEDEGVKYTMIDEIIKKETASGILEEIVRADKAKKNKLCKQLFESNMEDLIINGKRVPKNTHVKFTHNSGPVIVYNYDIMALKSGQEKAAKTEAMVRLPIDAVFFHSLTVCVL